MFIIFLYFQACVSFAKKAVRVIGLVGVVELYIKVGFAKLES